ncbi:hypothetical protein [Arthrobacter terrae]|uniref:hypothetical protein n=1 Tax=Arthrobacter terrae TaxID=2935737 RepID=UPI001E62DAF1|nr:hypothetical protein [Arthrobacter terrae]
MDTNTEPHTVARPRPKTLPAGRGGNVFSARTEAAARTEYNLAQGLEPNDETSWNELGGQPRATALARAAVLIAAIDAADDRIRLTIPEFHAIKADAIGDLSHALHRDWDADQLTSAQAAGVPDCMEAFRSKLAGSHLEPANHESAMASLISERTAAALRSTADTFDYASLADVTADMDIDPGVSPRFMRIMIRGCADWLRTRADELDAGTRIPYYRVNTRAVIDEDRHTALLGALGRVVDRADRLTNTGLITASFILTEHLVEAIEAVGATIPTES